MLKLFAKDTDLRPAYDIYGNQEKCFEFGEQLGQTNEICYVIKDPQNL